MTPIFLHNEATGQQFGYTAMNQLLDPHVEEVFRQIHRAEDEWGDDFIDFDVKEIVDEQARGASGAHRPEMWSSHWRPFAGRNRAWRPNDYMRKVMEDIEDAMPRFFSTSGASGNTLARDDCYDDGAQVDDRRASIADDVNDIYGQSATFSGNSGANTERDSVSDSSLVSMNHLGDVTSPSSQRPDTSDNKTDVQENQNDELPIPLIREALLLRFNAAFFNEEIWSSRVDVQLSHPDEPQSIDPLQLAEEEPFVVLTSEDLTGSMEPPESDKISIEDEFEVTFRAMCIFADHYIGQISQGFAEHMTVTRDKILEDHEDDEEASAFGFLGKTVDDVAELAQMLYDTSSANAPQTRKKLRTLHARVSTLASTVRRNAEKNDLHSSIFNRAWDMMYACMEDIDDAHQGLLHRPGLRNFADEVHQTERSIWRDWLANIHASIRAGDEDGSSLFMQNFVFVSLHWWQKKTSLALQRRKGRRGPGSQARG